MVDSIGIIASWSRLRQGEFRFQLDFVKLDGYRLESSSHRPSGAVLRWTWRNALSNLGAEK